MNAALKRLDSAHKKLLETISPLASELFCERPSKDEWSVAEVVHHLCLVEERVIKDLEAGLRNPPRKIGFLRKFVPTSIVAYRLLRVKAPKAVNPLNPPTREEIIKNYNAARNRLKELCSSNGPDRLRQVIFKHPFLGEIDGVATIAFVGYHELRHYKQIREVLKKLGHFPFSV
ncbi:MAG: DinB family protein [Pyrinomonadaceae bacterium]